MNQNVIHLGQKKEIDFKQEAWCDVTTFEAPYSGRPDAVKMWNALSSRFTRRGSIVGSSYGSTSITSVEIDIDRKVVKWTESVGIGD